MVRHAFTRSIDTNPSMSAHYGKDRMARLLLGHRNSGESAPSQGGHFATVPLPSMNADFTADGRIRRVLVMGWGINDEEDRALFGDLVRGVDGMELQDAGRVVGTLRAANSGTQADTLKRWRTLGGSPAKVWRTVTPIILTGHPRKGRSLEACLARALAQQGFLTDVIESIAVFAGPIVPKCSPAREFHVADYLKTTRRVHAEIIVRVPLVGPLVIGRGRFAGFGVMIPSA